MERTITAMLVVAHIANALTYTSTRVLAFLSTLSVFVFTRETRPVLINVAHIREAFVGPRVEYDLERKNDVAFAQSDAGRSERGLARFSQSRPCTPSKIIVSESDDAS